LGRFIAAFCAYVRYASPISWPFVKMVELAEAVEVLLESALYSAAKAVTGA
jgi:hypothetical protein